jgi:hypothetical protein
MDLSLDKGHMIVEFWIPIIELSWDIGSQVMMDKQVQVLNGVHREIHLPL